ncbi:MAG TPA: DMT family transporter [Elusimicrobiota bacterium]|nr:DMT family transporter [Elusimicrobiota bacterium]
MSTKLKNELNMLIGVVLISFSPLVVKAVSFTPTMGAFYRSLYSAIFVALLTLTLHRNEFGFDNFRWVVPSMGAGIFLGIDFALWHKAIVYIGAGPATFLGNSQIIFMTLFAALIFREPIPAVFYACVVVIFSGLYLLLPQTTGNVSRPIGYLLGISVGLTYAGMLICQRVGQMRAGAKFPRHLSLALIFIFSAVTVAAWNAIFDRHSYSGWDFHSHFWMALTGLGAQAVGWSLITSNITNIPAHEGSLLLMLQPVLAMGWGVIFFAEPFGIPQIIGMALALGGILFYQLRYSSSRQDEKGYVE